MSRQFLTAIDLAQNELQNPVAQNLGAHPTTPTPKRGQFYMNTTDNTLYWFNGSGWVSAVGGAGAFPGYGSPVSETTFGQAGGNGVSALVARSDHAHGTPSLGTSATTAAAGNDPRLSDARTPIAHAATHQPGGSDQMAVDQADATASLRTLGQTSGKAMPGTTRLNGILAPTADVGMASFKITALANGTNPTDAVNLSQLDSVAAGIDVKQSVKVATIAQNNLAGPQTIDGVAVVNGDRVLAKNQTAPAQNGIYTANTGGSWGRASDMDAWAEVPGAFVFVEQGTTQADTGWVSTADQGGTINTTAITWTQFSGAGEYIAGGGIGLAGNTFSVAAGNGIVQDADGVSANFGGTGAANTLARSDHNHDTAYPPVTRTIATTAPLTGGGDLSANRTLAISNFAGSVPGAVPGSPGGTTSYLRADGTWNAPTGVGQVNKVVAACAAATSTVVNHTFGLDCIAQVYRNSAPYDQVECDIEHTSTTTLTVRFTVAPAANAFRIVVMGA